MHLQFLDALDANHAFAIGAISDVGVGPLLRHQVRDGILVEQASLFLCGNGTGLKLRNAQVSLNLYSDEAGLNFIDYVDLAYYTGGFEAELPASVNAGNGVALVGELRIIPSAQLPSRSVYAAITGSYTVNNTSGAGRQVTANLRAIVRPLD